MQHSLGALSGSPVPLHAYSHSVTHRHVQVLYEGNCSGVDWHWFHPGGGSSFAPLSTFNLKKKKKARSLPLLMFLICMQYTIPSIVCTVSVHFVCGWTNRLRALVHILFFIKASAVLEASEMDDWRCTWRVIAFHSYIPLFNFIFELPRQEGVFLWQFDNDPLCKQGYKFMADMCIHGWKFVWGKIRLSVLLDVRQDYGIRPQRPICQTND